MRLQNLSHNVPEAFHAQENRAFNQFTQVLTDDKLHSNAIDPQEWAGLSRHLPMPLNFA